MSVDMPSLLADFEVNERRVYGYNCIRRANQFVQNMNRIEEHRKARAD
jgi:hypothetical protein